MKGERREENKRRAGSANTPRYTYLIAVCLLALLILLLGCGKTQEGLLPKTIGQFELAGTLKGDDAKRAVKSLHGNANVEPEEVEIGEYFNGNYKAKLWVSRSKNIGDAEILTKRMTALISKGTSPFGMPKETTIKDKKVIELEGMGQKHYYYQSKDKVIWLSADTSLADEAINDLLSKEKGK